MCFSLPYHCSLYEDIRLPCQLFTACFNKEPSGWSEKHLADVTHVAQTQTTHNVHVAGVRLFFCLQNMFHMIRFDIYMKHAF